MPQDRRQGASTSTVYGRVGTPLVKRVKAVAKAERRSVNAVIILALERYVKENATNGR